MMVSRRLVLLVAASLSSMTIHRVAARDPDPFEALADGVAGASTTYVRKGMGEARPQWRVSTSRGESVEVRADATYSIPGAPGNVPTRAALLPHGGALTASTNETFGSSTVVLDPSNGFNGFAAIDSAAALPVFGVTLEDLDGVRKLTFSSTGQPIRVVGSGETAKGEQYGGALGALEDPVITIESTDESVVTVTSSGEAISQGTGLAWIRVEGDGEWTQVLVDVDTRTDSDGDGMPDAWEEQHGLDPERDDSGEDADEDGLTNLEELHRGTLPDRVDTDGDGLGDGDEVLVHGTDPRFVDTDGDTLPDGVEMVRGTDPLDPNDRGHTEFQPELQEVRALNFWVGRQLAVTLDDRIYVTTDDGALILFAIRRSPFTVLRRDNLSIGDDLHDVVVDGSTVYVAGGDDGIHVVETSPDLSLEQADNIVVPGGVLALCLEGGIVYAVGSDGLTTLRRRGDGSHETLATLQTSAIGSIAIHADVAYVTLAVTRELVAIDISDPTSPQLLDRLVFPVATRPFSGIVALHKAVYVAHGSGGIIAVDNADPTRLEILDESRDELPGATFLGLTVLGNRLVSYDPASRVEAQIFRILESGEFEHHGTALLGTPEGVRDLGTAQELLFALSPYRISVVSLLPESDFDGIGPHGRVVIEEGGSVFSPGDRVTVTAYARDDVYVERVKFFIDGELRVDDQVPPYRVVVDIDDSREPPYDIGVQAVGFDLGGAFGEIGTVRVRVDGDLDGDGLPDGGDPDTDGDGLTDVEELFLGADGWISDPRLMDTDHDGIEDGEEVVPGADGWITDPSSADTDGDGLSDIYEIVMLGTDPTDPDDDDDGVLDGDEDSDEDGLSNRGEEEANTDPQDPDSDDDRLADGIEVEIGLDPRDADSDDNGVPDGEEDSDGDGLPNRIEVSLGTNPGRADTDGDGLDDATELGLGSDPSEPNDFSDFDVEFRNRTVILTMPLVVKSLRLENAVVTTPRATVDGPVTLDLEVSGRLEIGPRSRIDVSGKGYLGGRSGANGSLIGRGPDGVASGGVLAGGSHAGAGGRGGAGNTGVMETFGSPVVPTSAGGGGSAVPPGGRGGDGGGAIHLVAGELLLAGAIVATGEGVPGIALGSTGAGGSIWIVCDRIAGAGHIGADGGDAAGGSNVGAGGGGRVVIDCADREELDGTAVTARGGRLLPVVERPVAQGAPGTVIFRNGSDGGDELIVDNGDVDVDTTRTSIVGPGVGTIAAIGDDFIVRAEGSFPADLIGLHIDPNADDDDVTTFRIVGQSADTIFTEPGVGEVAAAGDVFRGVLRLERLSVTGGARLAIDERVMLRATDAPLSLLGGVLEVGELVIEQAPGLEIERGQLDLESLLGLTAPSLPVSVVEGALRTRGPLRVGELVADRSTLTVGAPVVAAAISLLRSTLTVPDPVGMDVTFLDLDVGGVVDVGGNSSIDLVGKGFVGAYGPGNPSPLGRTAVAGSNGGLASGGSSAGVGGDASRSDGPGGTGFGILDGPDAPGGGGNAEIIDEPGAEGVHGGNGGGLLRLRAASLVLAGVIDASGVGASESDIFDTLRAGAGGGGGIFLDVETLEGAGVIRADGGDAKGDADTGHGGGGGGGRIALHVGDRSGFRGSMTVAGGGVFPGPALSVESNGAPGTLFVIEAGSTRGELVIDGEERVAAEYRTVLGEYTGGAPIDLARFVLRGGAFVESRLGLDVEGPDESNPNRYSLLGALRAPSLVLPHIDVLGVYGGGLDVGVIETRVSGVRRYEVQNSTWVLRQPIRGSTFNMRGASILTVPDSTADRVWDIDIEISGAFTLEQDSLVDLRGKGYVGGRRGGNESSQGQTGDGQVFASGGRTGGAHGGLGGYQSPGFALGTVVAPTYDDFQRPRRPGGGGSGLLGTDETGFNGGGRIRIQASSLILDGRIDVSGNGVVAGEPAASSGGAGAGGSVWLVSGGLLGRGEINADGGDADGDAGSGGGGGGRVAIHFGSKFGFAASVHAYGGNVASGAPKESSVGGAGTVFFKEGVQLYGDLIVDNGGLAQSFPRTSLRPVGSGTVVSLDPHRLGGSGSFPIEDTRLEGQWVVLDGGTAAPVRIVGNSTNELETDPADGDLTSAAAVGWSYRGAIVLDNLLITGEGRFSSQGDYVIINETIRISDGGMLDAPPVVEW